MTNSLEFYVNLVSERKVVATHPLLARVEKEF